MTSVDLRNEILELELNLIEKKKVLFLKRLETIINQYDNISNVKINISLDTWNISYLHSTTKFSSNYYCIDDVTNTYSNNTSGRKNTNISFGKNKKYFIKGGVDLNIYRNTANELRIVNIEYEFDLDMHEQRILMIKYANNVDIPEWMAIKVFLYLSDNNWDDLDIIRHLSII